MSFIINSAVKGGLPGYAFVYVGTYIVPNLKKIISILLAFLVVIFSVLSLIISGNDAYLADGVFGVLSSWQNIITIISTIIGAVMAVVTVYED